jgi:hypothetical protein
VKEPWLTLWCWVTQTLYRIPGVWRFCLLVAELRLYGGWRARKAALARLDAYLETFYRTSVVEMPVK